MRAGNKQQNGRFKSTMSVTAVLSLSRVWLFVTPWPSVMSDSLWPQKKTETKKGMRSGNKQQNGRFKSTMSIIVVLIAWSCSTYCDPVDYNLPGSSVHGGSSGKNTGVGGHALFQGIFPTQGSNSGLLRCRRILYHLSHQGSPMSIITLNINGLNIPVKG